MKDFRTEKIKFNGDSVDVLVPTNRITWNEFVKEVSPIVKKLKKRI